VQIQSAAAGGRLKRAPEGDRPGQKFRTRIEQISLPGARDAIWEGRTRGCERCLDPSGRRDALRFLIVDVRCDVPTGVNRLRLAAIPTSLRADIPACGPRVHPHVIGTGADRTARRHYRSEAASPCCPGRPLFGAGKHRLVGRRRSGATLRALQLGPVPRLAGPIEGLRAVVKGSRDQGGGRLEVLRVRIADGFRAELSQRRGIARNRWNARSPGNSSVRGWSLLEWADSESLAHEEPAAAGRVRLCNARDSAGRCSRKAAQSRTEREERRFPETLGTLELGCTVVRRL
jgi:hypothetical protein